MPPSLQGLNLSQELCHWREDEWLSGTLIELVGHRVLRLLGLGAGRLMASSLMAEERFKTLLKCSAHLSTVFVLSVTSVFMSSSCHVPVMPVSIALNLVSFFAQPGVLHLTEFLQYSPMCIVEGVFLVGELSIVVRPT